MDGKMRQAHENIGSTGVEPAGEAPAAKMLDQKIVDQYAADRREFFRRAFLMLGFNGISGDYAEFGCYSGTTFRLAFEAYTGARQHLSFISYPLERKLWALDSFRGLPRQASPHDAHPAWTEGNLMMTVDDFHATCMRNGIPRQLYKVVEGYYSDSLDPADSSPDLPQDIALAYVDCDLYTSIVSVLQFLQPRFKHGMLIALDDYFIYSASEVSGARRALVESFSRISDWRLVPYMQYGWSGMSYILESVAILPNRTAVNPHGFI